WDANPWGHDANGNPGVSQYGNFPYDVENRLLQPPGAGMWTYDPSGKRVFLGGAGNANSTCELYFYGISGKKLATYSCSYNGSGVFSYSLKSRNVYFAGKLVKSTDNNGLE